MSDSSSSTESEAEATEVRNDDSAWATRAADTTARRAISNGLCSFTHMSMLQPRQLFCLQVTHNEVACGDSIDLKLLLESLSGHEVAAKKDLKFWMDLQRRRGGENEFLSQLPPPPPLPPPPAGRWQRKGGGKGKAAVLTQREPLTPQDEIMKLMSLHEGEQRTWAYPLHYINVPHPFPEETDRDIAERFVQFRKPSDVGPLSTTLALGVETDRVPSNENCASFLLARAVGSDNMLDDTRHYAVRALTLSLPEVFLAYREITTSKALYAKWCSGRQVVGVRERSMSISPAPGTSSGSGVAAGSARSAKGPKGGGDKGGGGRSRRRSRSR